MNRTNLWCFLFIFYFIRSQKSQQRDFFYLLKVNKKVKQQREFIKKNETDLTKLIAV